MFCVGNERPHNSFQDKLTTSCKNGMLQDKKVVFYASDKNKFFIYLFITNVWIILFY